MCVTQVRGLDYHSQIDGKKGEAICVAERFLRRVFLRIIDKRREIVDDDDDDDDDDYYYYYYYYILFLALN